MKALLLRLAQILTTLASDPEPSSDESHSRTRAEIIPTPRLERMREEWKKVAL